MITKTSHQNQIAHSTNKMLTAQTKTLTAQMKTLTAQTKTLTPETKTLTAQTKTLTGTTKSRWFIVPLSRFEERGNHLAVAGEDLCRSSWLPDEGILGKRLGFGGG